MSKSKSKTLIEFARWVFRIKGLDKNQWSTYIDNELSILDVLFYVLKGLRMGEDQLEDIKKSAIRRILAQTHPNRHGLRFNQICKLTYLSRRTVKKHLDRLKEIGLVQHYKGGYYSISDESYEKRWEALKNLELLTPKKIWNLIEEKRQ